MLRSFQPSASAGLIALVAASQAALAQPAPTFNKDVAPIVFAKCAPCHRPGEIGPFSLLTYGDLRQRLSQIQFVTARRLMPPWKPQEGSGPFVDDRTLSAAELRTLQDWIAGGAEEGDRRDLPPAPVSRPRWALGAPDVIVSMSERFLLPADGGDVFRTFVIPIPTPAPRYVRALEFQPGNARVVHHANLGIDRTRSSRRLDELDPALGYAGGMVPEAGYPPGHMLGWTPGQRPRPSPDGMAWRLERDSDFVVQLHLQPTGKPEPVQVSVGLFFTDEAPTRAPVGLRLGSQTIDIAAGDPRYVVSDSYTVPVEVELLAIQPHAHNLARRVEATVTLPDRTTRPLIRIDDWDFRWQDVYRFVEPIALPKGSIVRMRFEYDNSAANPRNPHRPPRRVVWGQNTSDEMGDLWLQFVPRAATDLSTLNADVTRKRYAEDLAAFEKLAREDPRNPLRRDALAMLYLQGGRAADAASELRESLKLNPDSAPTHYNLGLSLTTLRAFEEAAAEYREALRLAPEYPEAHNNLAAVLHFTGSLDDAARHYRLAIAFRPDHAEARNNLARLLTQQGHYAEAVEQFQRALTVNPDFASALAGLAWVRATSPGPLQDAVEAVRLAERADRITGHQDPSVLDALAAAYAAAGQFDRAVEVAEAARVAASGAGLANLAAEIGLRLVFYQKGQPHLARP